MQPETPLPSSPAVLEYFNPDSTHGTAKSGMARCLAGVLAASALALAVGVIAQEWTQNRVLAFGVCLLVVVACLLALRALNRCRSALRFGWLSAVVVFG